LFRHPDGRTFAIQDNVRRHVPDLTTLRALGYPGWAVLDASEAALDVMPEGEPVGWLWEGMVARSASHPAVFRLQNGRRIWLRDGGESAGGSDPSSNPISVVDDAVLGAIPVALQNDSLVRGNSSEVFHVEAGTLRKIPDSKWATDRRLNPQDALFVPDRQLAQLPQNSPHWIMPGGTYEDQSFFSPALGRQMPHRVFLPPEYAARSGQRYPVLYLLHGMGGRYDEWSGYGVEEVANMLLADKALGHLIIVAPQGGLGYWTNQQGGVQWADYVARDLVAHVDTVYRTVAKREGRAIGGLSMGAHGALQIALNNPQTFGVVGAHSPSIRSEEAAPAFFGRGAAFAQRDPISLVRDSDLRTPPRIWIDAGKDDPWLPGAEALHQALAEKGWAHEWHVYPGEHDGWYWGDHLWEYLPFYGRAFGTGGIAQIR
jgi:putative tributyrin esterase